MILDLKDLKTAEKQYYLQHVVAPRPVCFASTIDKAGNINLSPFSFFNLFSTNPPIVIFSPARRMRDNSTKHTLQNVLEVPEVVINIVDYDMVHQTSLASCEFPAEDNEFIKAGFTEEPATLIRPPMVKESKVKMECIVLEVKPLGSEGGAGNLVICEVLRMHIADELLDDNKKIDQRKLQLVARLGGGNRAGQFGQLVDFLAVDTEYHVAGLQPGFLRGAARFHAADQRALRLRQAE